MTTPRVRRLLVAVLLVAALTGCSGSDVPKPPGESQVDVDTPALQQLEAQTSVEPCRPGTGADGPLPDLTLPCLGGGRAVDLATLRGPLILNVWGSYCGPCREEMPQFIHAQAESGDKGLQFVGITVDQADKVRQFASDIGLNYRALIGGIGAMELSKNLGNSLMALPFTVVLDRDGRVAHTQLGPLKPEQLQSVVTPLLAARGHA